MPASTGPVARILNLVKLEHKEIYAVYFYALMNGLILLAIPIGIQSLIGFAQTNTASSSIVVLIILVVVSVFTGGIMQVKQMQIIEKIQQKIFVRYSFDISKKLPAFKLSAIDNYYMPELINRFFDVVTLQKSLAKLLLDFPLAIIQILFGLVLLAFYHPVFIAFGLTLILLIWAILYFSGTKGLEKSIEESTHKYKVAGWLEEMGRTVSSIKFFRSPYFLLHKTDEHVTNYLQARTAHFKILQLQYKTLIVFKTLITLMMLAVGVFLLLNQQLNVGQFIASEIVILTIINSIEKLIVNLDSVYDVLTAVEKIEQVTDKETETSGTLLLPDTTEGLRVGLNEVGYTYPGTNRQVFGNISFTIAPGEKICLQGDEGAGKSTLLRLLAGCYENFEGSIVINDIPIRNYELHSLRSKTALITSRQDIFEGSLLENICMGLEKPDMEELKKLCTVTGLNTFISTLKNGFDTQLIANGRKLPDHAVKKILLVRALISKPKLMLLEDPFSGLEEQVQNQVKNLLIRSLPDTSMLIITNDETFASQCDKIIMLSKTGCTVKTIKH